MNKSTEHRNRILEAIKNAGERGINSRVLINTITPRYSARLKELRQQGHLFKTRREPIGGSNLIRIWYEGKRNGETVVNAPKKPVRYEFVGNFAIPIYA